MTGSNNILNTSRPLQYCKFDIKDDDLEFEDSVKGNRILYFNRKQLSLI